MFDTRTGRRGTFSKTRTGLKSANKAIVTFLILFCVFSSVVWFFLFSGFWDVTGVENNDLEEISRGEAVSSTFDILDSGPWRPWSKRNIILINKSDLADKLVIRLFAENVAVDKVYPNILRLMITERQRSVILASKDQLVSVDTNGIVTGDPDAFLADNSRKRLTGKTVSEFKYPPLVVCDLPELVTAGYQVTNPDIVKKWLDAHNAFIRGGLKFRYLMLESPDSRTVKLRMDKGYDLILDLESPLEPQIETYRKFVLTQPASIVIREYLDLRVPGKLFIK